MRSSIPNAFVALLALIALAASAPAVSYGSPAPLCDPTTVFLASTVTVYQPSTVFVTIPCSSESGQGTPTTTLTLHSTVATTYYPKVDTIYLTTPGKSSTGLPQNAVTTAVPQHVTTITETTILVITNVQLTPYPYGDSLTHTEVSTSNGLLSFVVENGTMYWLNGQTPAPSKSYVVHTSVVTVEPVPQASETSEETSTTTIHVTHHSTSMFTIIETLSAPSSTPSAHHQFTNAETPCTTSILPSYVGTGSTFTGIHTGGWNATSSALSGGTDARNEPVSSPSTLSLIPYDPSQPITFATTFMPLSLSSLAAQSGFNDYSSSTAAGSTSIVAASSSATAAGVYSTISNPPYTNTTSLASTSPSTVGAGSSTDSAVGTAVSSVSSSLLTSYSSTTPYAASSTTTTSLYSTGVPLSTAPSSTSLSQTSTSALSTPPYLVNSTTVQSSYSTGVPHSTAPPTISNQTSTYVSSTASATPTKCGEQGDFTLTFDDIPPLSISDPDPNNVSPEPVFNPYHQFDFSDGWVVVPPPTAPYLPSSMPLFTEFIPDFNVNGTNPMAGPNTAEYGYSGDIGNCDHGLTGCFGFNMYGASFGCDSHGPPCVFSFTGFRLDKNTGNTTAITSETISIPACPALANCTLTLVTLNNSFKDLDSIRINVTVASEPKIWWMDDLRLGWYDNSCKAGLCRVSTPIH